MKTGLRAVAGTASETARRRDTARPPVAPAPELGNQSIQRLLRAGAVSAKLEIGAPDDPLERDADRAADRVMRKPAAACSCAPGARSCPECGISAGASDAGAVRRKPAPLSGGDAGAPPPAVRQALRGSGRPLDRATRSDMEARFGRDFGEVRVHDGPAAAASATAIHALAYTAGSHIVFGQGRYAPQADSGRWLLAHELAHVAQAQTGHVGQPAAAVRRKDETPVVIVPVGGAGEPLAAYAAMRERLSPSDWNALNAAARRRADTVATGQAPPQANELVKSEISVPVSDLFQPQVNQSKASGGDQWLRDVYALADSGGAQGEMSQRIRDEILYRWIDTSQGILQEPVTIALVDPDGRAGGVGSLLTFVVRGRAVPTPDGLLTIATVDQAIGGSIDQSVQQMGGDLSTLAAAIERTDAAKAKLKAARDITGQDHAKIAAQTLDRIDAALRQSDADLGAIAASPFAELVQPVRTELGAFLGSDFASFRKADVEWRAANPRPKSEYEKLTESREKVEEENKKDPSVFNMLFIIDSAKLQGYQDIATGGATEQAQQLGKAYDAGLISYESWLEGAAKIERRGMIFAGVTAALTIATAGLGLYVAPVTLGGAVLFGAATGFVVATGPMFAANLYTSQTDFADPALQQWWKGSAYSARDIAVAGTLGVAIGAALPIAGKVLGGLLPQGPAAVAALEAGAAVPEGVVARTVSKGVVDLSIEAEGVTIRVSATGYKMTGRAGSSAAAVIQEGTWPAELAGEGGLGPGTRFDIAHPSFPSSVAFGERGWGMVSPQSRLPVQFGVWPELALPGAVPEPAATASPLLLDAAAGAPVTPIVGGDSSLVLAGASLPQGVPMKPPPLMLGAGPQPFGLLSAPFPDITYAGPTVPQSFEQSVTPQWGTQVARSGVSMLPYVGEGGVWLRLPSGEWAPAYYQGRPGGMPGASLVTYGTDNPAFLVNSPGSNLSAYVQPRPGGSYAGARRYPMASGAMFDPLTGMTHGRGHMVPHASTPEPAPGQALATTDPRNYVAHPRKYNEWIRNNLEQMLKREGMNYTAHDVIGSNPRITSGGYVIPEAELFVQYGAAGAPVRAWRFPLAANPAYYETLAGSFADVLPQFEIKLAQIPLTPVRK